MGRAFCSLALLALLVAGCEPGASARRQMEGAKAPDWPELQALQGDGGLMVVGMALDREGAKAATKAAAAPQFKQLVDAFEKAPIPSGYATAARETAKKNIVDSLRKVAEGGSDEELKSLWQKVRENMKTVTSP